MRFIALAFMSIFLSVAAHAENKCSAGYKWSNSVDCCMGENQNGNDSQKCAGCPYGMQLIPGHGCKTQQWITSHTASDGTIKTGHKKKDKNDDDKGKHHKKKDKDKDDDKDKRKKKR